MCHDWKIARRRAFFPLEFGCFRAQFALKSLAFAEVEKHNILTSFVLRMQTYLWFYRLHFNVLISSDAFEQNVPALTYKWSFFRTIYAKHPSSTKTRATSYVGEPGVTQVTWLITEKAGKGPFFLWSLTDTGHTVFSLPALAEEDKTQNLNSWVKKNRDVESWLCADASEQNVPTST